MKKAYETPELEVLFFDLRDVAMLDALASGTPGESGTPNNGAVFDNFDDFGLF